MNGWRKKGQLYSEIQGSIIVITSHHKVELLWKLLSVAIRENKEESFMKGSFSNFKCQIENCNREFVHPSNLKRRHVRDLHDEKQYVFQEPGCADTNQSCERTRILM